MRKNWPPEKGAKGDTHTDSDGSFTHNGNGWINQNDGSSVLSTVTITSTTPMDDRLVMAATGQKGQVIKCTMKMIGSAFTNGSHTGNMSLVMVLQAVRISMENIGLPDLII